MLINLQAQQFMYMYFYIIFNVYRYSFLLFNKFKYYTSVYAKKMVVLATAQIRSLDLYNIRYLGHIL